MKTLDTLGLAALVGLALAGPARAQGHHHGATPHTVAGSPQSGARDDASTAAFKAADAAMMKNMDIAYTGDPDVDFRAHMMPHHQGAIDMARVALKHAKDPATKALARKIIADQEREIGEMQAWLKKNAK